MKSDRSKRAAGACALFVALGLISGCGGGGGGGGGAWPSAPVSSVPPAGTAPVDTTVPVSVLPDREDPSSITRFSATVPFGEKGSFTSSEQVVYNFGTTAVSDAKFKDVIYTVPLRGTVRYPSGPAGAPGMSKVQPSASGGYPVVVFLHGMHDASELKNAQGYDYLQKSLAENGYVALSIDAGKINGLNNSNASDAGALARGQLLMTTLDLLRAGNATGVFNGAELPGLKGKLDLDRVGILGHSRGAEAVAYAVELNRQRIGISYQDVDKARELRTALSKAQAEQAQVQARVDAARAAFDAVAAKLVKAKEALAAAQGLQPPAPSSLIDFLTQEMQQLESQTRDATAKLDAEKIALEAAKAKVRQARAIALQTINADSKKWLEAITSPDALSSSGVVLPSSSEPPHKLRAVFSLAPINAKQLSRVTHVPFGTLLPTCDGDVYDMPGAQIFDDSRYTADDESAPKFQIVVRGANHNFYNSHWSESDDATSTAPLHCKKPGLIETLRLTAPDQRRNGAFLMESFMRYFVGDEAQFAPYWKGQAPIPAAGCPAGEATCDERVVLTIHQPVRERKLLQNFRTVDSSAKNPSGLLTSFENFKQTVQCRFLGIGGWAAPTRTASCSDPATQLSAVSLFEEGEKYILKSWGAAKVENMIWSVTDQAQLRWDAPGPTVSVNTGDLSAKGFDTLSLRVAVVAPIGQEVEVSVSDTQDRTAIVKGSDFSDALYGIARKRNGSIPLIDAPEDAIYAETGATRPLLNMVAIPLKAFALHGVDIEHIKQVKLRFPKASGSVAVTDVQLQRMD